MLLWICIGVLCLAITLWMIACLGQAIVPHSGANDHETSNRDRLLMVFLVLMVPLTALLIYGILGRPDLPDQPYAARDLNQEQSAQNQRSGPFQSDGQQPSMEEIQQMVDGLAERLEQEPDDVQGWRMLARSSMVLQDLTRYHHAISNLVRLVPKDIDARLELTRILRQQANEIETPDIRHHIAIILEQEPENVEALWFSAIAAFQDGNRSEAERIFAKVIALVPEQDGMRARFEDLRTQILESQ